MRCASPPAFLLGASRPALLGHFGYLGPHAVPRRIFLHRGGLGAAARTARESEPNWMSDDRPKMTRTTRHMLGPAGQSGNLAALGSPSATARPPAFRERLLWRVSPKTAYEPGKLARWIGSHPHNPQIFVDASLFDRRAPMAVWDALPRRFHGLTSTIMRQRSRCRPYSTASRAGGCALQHPVNANVRVGACGHAILVRRRMPLATG